MMALSPSLSYLKLFFIIKKHFNHFSLMKLNYNTSTNNHSLIQQTVLQDTRTKSPNKCILRSIKVF